MSDRDTNGRWLPGHAPSGRRPRRPDFYTVIREHAATTGESVEQAMVRIYAALLAAACKGDVAAAKLLLEHLCDSTPAPSLALPSLTDAKDIEAALREIVAGAADGTLDMATAATMAALVERVGLATHWADLARRVADIEAERTGRRLPA